MAVRPATDAPGRDPNLQTAYGRDGFEVQHVECCCASPGGVILMRERRAEHGVDIGALVPDGEL